MRKWTTAVACGTTFLLVATPLAWAQSGANSDPNYVALRNLTLGPEAVSVSNFEFTRDTGKFRLNSGTVCFAQPVNGKVTAAVFTGDGDFLLNPPAEAERNSLKLLTKEEQFNEKFDRLVLRFADSTYEEIKKAGTPATGGCDTGALKDNANTARHNIKHNLEAEILGEILSPEPRGVFVAFIHGKRYSGSETYTLDPNKNSDQGQVDFSTYDENLRGEWASFDFTEPHAKGTVGQRIRIDHHDLDTTLDENGTLHGKATTTFQSQRNWLRVVPFSLFHTLRVQSVTAEGKPLPFIQEYKNEDADFAVILPKPLAAGESFTVTTIYSGSYMVANEVAGGGTYNPISHYNWYPNSVGPGFGEHATYDLTFRIPKGIQIAATGVLVRGSNEGGQNVSVWKSEAKQTAASFLVGRFEAEDGKLAKPEISIRSRTHEGSALHDANLDYHLPSMADMGENRYEAALGSTSATSLSKKALAEAEIAEQLYSDYFGPSLFTHLELTQQAPCNFGQSWPAFIWIPSCAYVDASVRRRVGLDWSDRGYWKVVTPHEVAHQWWGNTVAFESNRDQWMSEGFSDMSASLYLSMVEKDSKKFVAFWNDERELLLERNPQGFRAIDVGPLIMGYRTGNSRTGEAVTRRLLYAKGAYVLHMIRMMMYDSTTVDKLFKETMQDFVNTYRGKAATTEDFKAMVERHMSRGMDLDRNHKMDWFFNQYVYGTGVAQYSFHVSLEPTSDGKTHLKGQLTRTGVPDSWKDFVPLYAHEGEKTFRLGSLASWHPSEPLEATLPIKIDSVTINDFDDVLAEEKQ
ncbi:MAG: M1 family metallopeptidase [Candidatus Acidiferrales bacterium]